VQLYVDGTAVPIPARLSGSFELMDRSFILMESQGAAIRRLDVAEAQRAAHGLHDRRA
jgi:hypothetical protein